MNVPFSISQLPERLRKEEGMPEVGVAIWRGKGHHGGCHVGTVGEFLSRLENQSGDWYIDGGWGGPPGPIRVRWDKDHWVNQGFWPWGEQVAL